MYPKLDVPPLSLSGFSLTTQIGAILYKDYPSFAGETVGTRINRGNPHIMPPSFVRQAWPTTRRSRLYFTSSSALIFSPPCGSCSVFEVAHTVYKNASNRL